LIGHNFRCFTPNPILVIVGTDLQAAFHRNETSLVQVIGTHFSQFAPSHDIDKVRFPLSALGYKGSVYRERKTGHRHTRLGIAQLWISYESPNKNNSV
jgi:hypothetical protein